MRIFLAVVGVVLVAFAPTSKLNCDRNNSNNSNNNHSNAGYCTIQKRGFLWMQEKQIPVQDLKGAKLIHLTHNSLIGSSSELKLITNSGAIGFSQDSLFNSHQQNKKNLEKINKFARDRRDSKLEIPNNNHWWLMLGYICLAIGLVPIVREYASNHK